jgi:hypothetical protein
MIRIHQCQSCFEIMASPSPESRRMALFRRLQPPPIPSLILCVVPFSVSSPTMLRPLADSHDRKSRAFAKTRGRATGAMFRVLCVCDGFQMSFGRCQSSRPFTSSVCCFTNCFTCPPSPCRCVSLLPSPSPRVVVVGLSSVPVPVCCGSVLGLIPPRLVVLVLACCLWSGL